MTVNNVQNFKLALLSNYVFFKALSIHHSFFFSHTLSIYLECSVDCQTGDCDKTTGECKCEDNYWGTDCSQGLYYDLLSTY